MLKFQWNAMRHGQRVIVHDPASAHMTLVPGTVVMTETHRVRKGADGVGIRIADDSGATRVLWPSYLAVHLDPPDETEPCWRCQEIESTMPELRRCGRCMGMFPGDPTLPRGLDAGWWACPPCHELLIGPGALAMPTWAPKVPTGAH